MYQWKFWCVNCLVTWLDISMETMFSQGTLVLFNLFNLSVLVEIGNLWWFYFKFFTLLLSFRLAQTEVLNVMFAIFPKKLAFLVSATYSVHSILLLIFSRPVQTHGSSELSGPERGAKIDTTVILNSNTLLPRATETRVKHWYWRAAWLLQSTGLEQAWAFRAVC